MANIQMMTILGIAVAMAILASNQAMLAKPDCTSVTAALAKNGKIMLYFRDKMEVYNATTRRRMMRRRIAPLRARIGGGSIDAVFTLPRYPKSIFYFTGRHFYRLSRGNVAVKSGDIKRFLPRNKFFQKGNIDAVAQHNGTRFFFKGCKVIKVVSRRFRNLMTTHRLRLPCHVDAAFEDNDSMVVMKGPLSWKMVSDGKRLRAEPYCFICPPATAVSDKETVSRNDTIVKG